MAKRHVMIDLETLATTRNAVVLSIGATIFDPTKKGMIDTLELKVDIEEQTEVYNRFVSEDTLKWWSTQSPEAILEAMGDEDRVPYKEAIDRLRKFCWGAERVWSNGSIFDVIIVEDCLNDLELPSAWQFYNVRDCRTIYELAGVNLKDAKYQTKTTHKALDDAIHQTVVLQDAYRKFIDAGFTHLL